MYQTFDDGVKYCTTFVNLCTPVPYLSRRDASGTLNHTLMSVRHVLIVITQVPGNTQILGHGKQKIHSYKCHVTTTGSEQS